MLTSEIIKFTPIGIYCPKADIYIDPVKVVNKAIITHAHSDHARKGHKEYITHNHTKALLHLFYGTDINVNGLEYGEEIIINGVKVSLHPAGHILGSSQVRLEYQGQVVVIGGDYKLENDNVSEQFQPIKCNVFVTESTFGQPKYKWRKQEKVFKDINNWWKGNQKSGLISFLGAYSLGKSQRLLKGLDTAIGNIFINENTANINHIYESSGIELPFTEIIDQEINTQNLKDGIIIAPTSFLKSTYIQTNKISVGFASGWMLDSYSWKFRNINKGFPISDHADFPGLIKAIKDSEAETIYVTHGFTSGFTKYLRTQGFSAIDVNKINKNSNEIELF